MSEKEYVIFLSPERNDRFRYSHRLVHGKITRFCVQYESLIGEAWHVIVRYDTAHGRPHKDILHPDGTREKKVFPGYTPAEILTLGERDIKVNWKCYRTCYEQELEP